MRLGGRLAAAIEVLGDMERRHRPAADALKDWGLSHRFAGAGDRAAIGNIVYDALRRRRSAGWLIGEDTARAQAFGAVLLEWDLTAAALNQALDGDRFAPQPLAGAELDAASSRSLKDAPPEIRADCPDWCAPLLQDAFREDWAAEGEALARRPPLDLRVNLLKADRAKLLAELGGISAQPTPLAQAGIRIAPIDGGGRHPNVQVEPAFQKGLFEIQDEGSQLAAQLAETSAGMQVLDFCAGGGGKTLALSAAMDNRGQIFAHDSDKARLAPIFDRLARAGSRNVQVVARAADLSAHRGQMDLVLVDAPCTGSGTWRRKPDAKWRLTRRQLDVRRAEQARILDEAEQYVRPAGRLVYVTCSVFPEENSGSVADFLSRTPGFEPVDHADLWSRHFPDAPNKARVDPQGGIGLSPARSGTDGFFICVLQRQA